MRKRLLIAAGVTALFAGGIGIGILVQREMQLARIRAGENFARELAGLNDPIPAAPDREEWLYPRAKVKGQLESAAVRISGELVRPAGHYAVLVTGDDFETVARHYSDKLKFSDPEAIAKSQLAFSSEGNVQGESVHLLDDQRGEGDPQSARALRTKCLVRRCPSYDLTVLLTRAEGERETHIIVLYDPKAPGAKPR